MNRKVNILSGEHIDGAMLSLIKGASDNLVIDRAGEGLNDDKIDDFDL